jgi:Mg-chelatase subunit ChlD
MKTVDPNDASFFCPITGELMLEPVVDHEGNTYEKAAIIEWLRDHTTSPITRNPLSIDQISPNRALQSLIETVSSSSSSSSPAPSSPTSIEKDTNEHTNSTTPPEPELSLQAFTRKDGLSMVRIHVKDDASTRHVPSKVICVIDVSGSMDDAATMHNDSDGSSGLSLLDVVKHATRTVIEVLGPQDQLAIVKYADKGEIVLPFTTMTPDNRIQATKKVEALRTLGSTNLYDGLLKAMDLAGANSKDSDNDTTTIFLLTDGMPNINPPRGILPTLSRYKEGKPDFHKCRISTFGFGYAMDSALLNEIAMEGNGLYSFIPDSSFVGTAFINAICGVLSTAVPSSTLSIELADEMKLDETYKLGHNYKEGSWGLSVTLPNLSYGQVFNVIFKLDEKMIKDNSVTFTASIGGFSSTGSTPFHSPELVVGVSESMEHDVLIHVAETRNSLVALIRTAEGLFDDKRKVELGLAKTGVESAIKAVDSILAAFSDNECLRALKQDLVGQVTEAYSREDWHTKWGRHYLLSLARAHELQQCSNFKDPGLQRYARSQKFVLLRDGAEEVFCKLPPPKASLAQRVKNYQPVHSMRRWHNSSTPCFAAGTVRLADGRFVPIDQIVAGDTLHTGQGAAAKVICVVVTECAGRMQDLVELEGGVLVTPWHPVRPHRSKDGWKFPADLGMIRSFHCDRVYSLVLDQGASMFQIGPFEAVSLGHGIEKDEVATHQYLGTNKVKEDLCRMYGWNDGLVQLGPNPGIRDPKSGLIVRFEQNIPLAFHTEEAIPSNDAVMVKDFRVVNVVA